MTEKRSEETDHRARHAGHLDQQPQEHEQRDGEQDQVRHPLVEAADEQQAIALANQSQFGLGAAIFTSDRARADRIAREIDAGSVFVNTFVKSDMRLPFGGVKRSGYGRELAERGIKELVNRTMVLVGRP